MDPQYRESEPEERAAERAADATGEPRERRGEEDLRIEDDDRPPARSSRDDPEPPL